MVHVAASSYGYVIGEEFVGGGDVDYVFDELADVLVAFYRYGDYAAGAGGYFLDVGEGLFVL